MARRRIAVLALALGMLVSGCRSGGADPAQSDGPRAGYRMMGLNPPGSSTHASPLVPDGYPCRRATGKEGYEGYGPGRMRRGGLAPEALEAHHIVIRGRGVNLHGWKRVADGATVDMEMDNDYFGPTILRGPPGATVTIELKNEGSRRHNFSLPQQGIDLNCGVRAAGKVEVSFPRSGVLMFFCKYGSTSGMRGALAVKE